MSIGLHAKRYNPWRSQWSPRRKVVTVTVTITTTGTNEIPNETLPQFLVRLCLCYNHHYACHHRFWVTDDCTLTEYFVVPFTVWSVWSVCLCSHFDRVCFTLVLVSSCSSLVWTVNRSLLCTTATSFLPCVQCTGRFLPFRHKTIEQLPYCVGRAAGGHPACGRMLIRPPPSFKKMILEEVAKLKKKLPP